MRTSASLPGALALVVVAALGLLLLGAQEADALTGALYADFTGNPSCSGTATGSKTNLDSGECFAIGAYGARAICNADGFVSQVALFEDHGCGIVFISGRGVGDGVSCITLRSPRTSTVWSAIIDCSAPGPASSGPSVAVIAGAAVGAVAGVALLIAGCWWCYKQQQTKQANTMMHSMSMQQQPQQQHGQLALQYAPSGAPTFGQSLPPGAMMALVCCVALLLPLAPTAAAQLA